MKHSEIQSMKVLFHHLPKTAGTTLISLLDQRYSLPEILPNGFFGVPARDVRGSHIDSHLHSLKSHSLIHGHFSASLFDTEFTDYYRITLLRDPLRRLWSLYRDWLTKSEESLEGAHPDDIKTVQLARTLPLEEFLELTSHPIPALFDNGQVRLLSGALDEERVDERHLQKAINTLDQMSLVGITECLESFVALLSGLLGWEIGDQLPALNVRNPKDPLRDLDQASIEALKARTMLDQGLYEYARSRFDSDIAQTLASHFGNRPADPRKRLQNPPPQNEIILTMDQGFDGSGWHVREGVGTGRIWRWTGPARHSTVKVGLKPLASYTLTLHVISVIHQEIVDGLNLYLNCEPLSWKHCGVQDGVQVIQAEIESNAVSPDENTLSLEVPFLASQTEVEPDSDDTRLKGIAITKIQISGH